MPTVKRALLAVLVALALAGCGSATPAPTQTVAPTHGLPSSQPTSGGPSAGPSAQPTASSGTGPTDAPATPGPGEDLLEPVLTDAAAVADALFDPEQVAQGVVSLLALMGVAIRDSAGTVVRAGSDRGAGELVLTDSQVRGLITMTRDDLTELGLHGGPYPLADMFTALQPSLPAGFTVEQLAAAYADAYSAEPEALAARVMRGQAIDAESGLLRIQEWVLLIDGFLSPPQTASMTGSGTGRHGLARLAAGAALGTARQGLPALTSPSATLTNAEWAEVIAALPTLASAIEFKVVASPGAIHEGHGATGSPADFLAGIGVAAPLVSRSSGRTLLAAAPQPGIRVTWGSVDRTTWAKHGDFDPALGTPQLVDPGQPSGADLRYTPIKEDANGAGTKLKEHPTLAARALQADLISHSYDTSSLGAALYLAAGARVATGPSSFEVGWHELGDGYVIDIVWTDYYNGIADVITFSGIASRRDSGVQGINAYYVGGGAVFGSRPGWTSCNPGVDVVPSGFGQADFQAGIQNGEVVIAAYPQIGMPLSGIFAGPFILPAEGGSTTISVPAQPGALCPHRVYGRIEAQPFGNP